MTSGSWSHGGWHIDVHQHRLAKLPFTMCKVAFVTPFASLCSVVLVAQASLHGGCRGPSIVVLPGGAIVVPPKLVIFETAW